VWLWDTVTWKAQSDFVGHNHVIFDVAFSPDGTTITSASEDETIKLWSLPVGASSEVRPGREMIPAPPLLSRANPSSSTGLPSGVQSMAEGEGNQAAPARSRWKIALAAMVLLGTSVLAVLAWLYSRRRAEAPTEAAASSVPQEESAEAAVEDKRTISFLCSSCGKKLRGKAELVGKRVPCPHCRTAIVVSDGS
jgi:hypothetical protein